MSNKLDGKVAVVVGAGSVAEGWSNGRACAVGYARAGATVVCVDRNLDSVEETVAYIEKEGGTGVALAADATNEDEVRAAVELATSRFGRLDIMHNNVGGSGTVGTPQELPPDEWEKALDQSLTSAYIGTRVAAPVMRAQGDGVITNISSILSVRFLRYPNVAYAAAKAALESMTRMCAVVYGPDGVRVNCIRVGFAETALLHYGLDRRGLSPEDKEKALARSRAKVPLRGEHTDPFDVSDAAVFLASDAARDITGVILNVDGGLDVAPI